MNQNSFATDLWIQYQNLKGQIKFISHRYITLCINPEVHKSKQTHVLIFPEDWKNISLLKESEK